MVAVDEQFNELKDCARLDQWWKSRGKQGLDYDSNNVMRDAKIDKKKIEEQKDFIETLVELSKPLTKGQVKTLIKDKVNKYADEWHLKEKYQTEFIDRNTARWRNMYHHCSTANRNRSRWFRKLFPNSEDEGDDDDKEEGEEEAEEEDEEDEEVEKKPSGAAEAEIEVVEEGDELVEAAVGAAPSRARRGGRGIKKPELKEKSKKPPATPSKIDEGAYIYGWDNGCNLPTRQFQTSNGKRQKWPEFGAFPDLEGKSDEELVKCIWPDGDEHEISKTVAQIKAIISTASKSKADQPPIWNGELPDHTKIEVKQLVDRDLLLYMYVGGKQRFNTPIKIHGKIPDDHVYAENCYQLENTDASIIAAWNWMEAKIKEFAAGKLTLQELKDWGKQEMKGMIAAWKAANPKTKKEKVEPKEEEPNEKAGPKMKQEAKATAKTKVKKEAEKKPIEKAEPTEKTEPKVNVGAKVKAEAKEDKSAEAAAEPKVKAEKMDEPAQDRWKLKPPPTIKVAEAAAEGKAAEGKKTKKRTATEEATAEEPSRKRQATGSASSSHQDPDADPASIRSLQTLMQRAAPPAFESSDENNF
jgi:hypothetical protein